MIMTFHGKEIKVENQKLYIDGLLVEGFTCLQVQKSMYNEGQPYLQGYVEVTDAEWGHWIKNAQDPIDEWVYDTKVGKGKGNKKPLWLAGVSRRKVLTINGTEMPLQPEAVKVRRKKGAKKLDN